MVPFLEALISQDCDLRLNKPHLNLPKGKTFIRSKIEQEVINKSLTNKIPFPLERVRDRMKKLIVVLTVLISTITFAQNKNAKATMEVDGVCMMCKSRIEKACLNTKGVKSAVWNVKTHELKLIFDERKTNTKTIQKNIVAVGHDTKNLRATDEAYSTVHACCKYRDDDVKEDHKKEEEAKEQDGK